jgi:hypothetical protein
MEGKAAKPFLYPSITLRRWRNATWTYSAQMAFSPFIDKFLHSWITTRIHSQLADNHDK